MDNRAEDERYKKERAGELNLMVEATMRAEKDVYRQMADFQGNDVAEAVRLMCLYVFYQHEHSVLNLRRAENAGLRDHPANRISVDEAEISGKALALLKTGDFRESNKYLMRHAKTFGALREADPAMDKAYSGAERILSLLPDRGEPIELPLPASQDSRFSGEGTSQ